MSKERLEEIDQIVDDLLNNRGELTNFVNDYYLQTERVQELVYENFQLKDDVNRLENEYLHGVKQQNNRYREAIEQVLHLKQQKENNVFEYSYDEIEEREESLLMDVLEESS